MCVNRLFHIAGCMKITLNNLEYQHFISFRDWEKATIAGPKNLLISLVHNFSKVIANTKTSILILCVCVLKTSDYMR